jgi:hypothetical protein
VSAALTILTLIGLVLALTAALVIHTPNKKLNRWLDGDKPRERR